MNHLVVEERAELREIEEPGVKQPPVLRITAQVISWIFHPVFLPVYLILFIAFQHPFLFAGWTDWQKMRVVLMGILMFTFFPVVTILLLKGLRFIDSIYLRTQKDRVIPFISSMIWYFWIWWVWKNMSKVPEAVELPAMAVQFALAAFISTIIGLMVNIVMKVSLHAIACGVVCTFMFILAFQEGFYHGPYLVAAVLITGLVCTARFIVAAHSAAEIYVGLLTGVASMLLAAWWG